MLAASDPVLFVEKQGFLRFWWWLLALTAGVTAGILALSRSAARPATSLPALPWLLLVSAGLLVGLFVWLRLDTRLDAQGISYRMRPLGWHRLSWAEVARAYVRQYAPIAEYGGWGIKGFSFQNYAFNVAGTQGLQLELTDGRRILLGTQHPTELRQALEKLRPTPPAS